MKAASIVFDGMTALDFFGFYDPLARLKSMAMDPAFEGACARAPRRRPTTAARARVARQMDYPYRWEPAAAAPSTGG